MFVSSVWISVIPSSLLTGKNAFIVSHPFAAFFQDALWWNLVAWESPVVTTGQLHFPGCCDVSYQKFNQY
jgi:hypothetical protein